MPRHRFTPEEARAAAAKATQAREAKRALRSSSPPPQPINANHEPPRADTLSPTSPDPRLVLVVEQIELARATLNGKLSAKDRAQLIRSLCYLLDRERILRGEPLPGSRKPAPLPPPDRQPLSRTPPTLRQEQPDTQAPHHDTAPKESLSPSPPVPTLPTPTPQISSPPSIYHPQALPELGSGIEDLGDGRGAHWTPGKPTDKVVPGPVRRPVEREGALQEIRLPNGEVIRVRAGVKAQKVVVGSGTKVP